MSKMSSNYAKDPSVNLSFAISSEKNGVESVIESYKKGTEEVRNLLRNECEVIYECSYCNSLCRGLVNFISHKRTNCRHLNSSVRAEAENRYLEQIVGKHADELVGNVEQKSSKPPSLRRFNMAANLSKHITNKAATSEAHTLPRKSARLSVQTKYQDGRQILDNIPLSLRMRSQLNEERAFLVMPEGDRDRSIRCGKMQLRFRRRPATMLCQNPQNGREITQKEAEIINRIPPSLQADYVALKCLDEECVHSGIPPFGSLIHLAYHLTFNHPAPDDEASDYPYVCFLCNDTTFRSDSELKDHFDASHEEIRKLYGEQNGQLRKLRNNATRNISRNSLSSADGQRSSLSTETYDEEHTEMDEQNENYQSDATRAGLEAIRKWQAKRSLLRDGNSVGRGSSTSTNSNSPTKTAPPPEMTRIPLGTTKKSSLTSVASIASTISTNVGSWSDGQQQSSAGIPRKLDGIISSVEAMEIDEALNSLARQFNQQPDDSDDVVDGNNNQTEAETDDVSNDNDEEKTAGQQHFADFADASDASDGEAGDGGILQISAMDPKRATKMGDEEMDNPSTQQEQEILSPRRRQRQPNRRFYNDQFVNPVDGEGLTKPADRDSSATATIGSLFSLLPKTNGVPICKRRSAVMVQPKRTPPERSAPPIKKRGPTATATLTLSPESKKQTFSAIDTLSSQCRQRQKPATKRRSTTKPKLPFTSFYSQSAKRSRIDITSLSEHSTSAVQSRQRLLRVGVIAAAPAEKRPSTTIPLVQEHFFDGFVKKLLAKITNYSLLTEDDDADESPPKSSSSNSSGRSVHSSPPIRATETRATQNQAQPSNSSMNNANDLKNDDEEKKDDQQQHHMESESEREQPPPQPEDLSKIPVYITEAQRDQYFASLKRLFDPSKHVDGNHQCAECGQQFSCKKDGQRHMVSHLRAIRLRCSLCQVGSFFCTDMRVHLMFRHCEMLHLAGDDSILPGSTVPCMDKKKADSLMQIVDPQQPGRVVSTSGKIVSWSNPKAHFPDPIIEQRILGLGL